MTTELLAALAVFYWWLAGKKALSYTTATVASGTPNFQTEPRTFLLSKHSICPQYVIRGSHGPFREFFEQKNGFLVSFSSFLHHRAQQQNVPSSFEN